MGIYEQQIQEGRVYAHLPVYKKRRAYAEEGIRVMRTLAPQAYVSLSFGKQSQVLAHMVWQVCPDMPMYFLASEETWEIDSYRDTIDTFCTRFPINLSIVQTHHFFSGNHVTWKDSRDAGQDDLQTMCNRNEWDGWYWGLAKEESKGRRITLSTRWDGQPHTSIYKYSDGKYRCCPLANWTVHDIAAYVAEYDLPMLWTYRRFGLQMRTTARITRNSAELSSMAYLKERNIAGYNRIVARYPELRSMS